MQVEVGQEAVHLDTRRRSDRAGSMRGPVTTIILRLGIWRRASSYDAATRRSRCVPTPEPPTLTRQTTSLSE